MSGLSTLVSHSASIALGWALVHFVWQGATVAAVLAVVRAIARRRSANVRYAFACAALAVMAALPVATFFVVRDGESSSITAVAAAPAPAAPPSASPALAVPASPATWERARIEPALPWLVFAWMAGVAALSIRFAAALIVTARIRRATREVAADWQLTCNELARRLGVRRTVRLCESALAEVPSVVGWLRPVVLVPAGVFVGLDVYQIEAILAHELAHVRRHDYLVNLVQSAVETLLFYHPAVWWVSGVVREEREHCCDDLAVATCGDVLTYATALADLEDLRVDVRTLAVAATGGSLARRIERLLGRAPAPRRMTTSAAGLLATAVVAASLVGAGAAAAPAFVEPQIAPPVPVAEALEPLASGGLTPVAAPARPLHGAQPIHIETAEPETPVAETSIATPVAEAPPAQEGEAGTSEYAAVGYPSLSREQLDAFRIQGISPDYIRSLAAAGYDRLSPDTLISMRIQGVDARFVDSLAAIGYTHLSADTLIAMRVHGVDADYAIEIADLGIAKPSADGLVNLRVQGVDAAYIHELRDLGYTDLGADDFVTGRVHGVSGDFARRWSALGYGHVAFDDLVAMRVHGVSTAFAQSVRDLGYTPTVDQLVAMRVHGVSLDYIRAAGDGGKVSIDRLIEMRVRGDR